MFCPSFVDIPADTITRRAPLTFCLLFLSPSPSIYALLISLSWCTLMTVISCIASFISSHLSLPSRQSLSCGLLLSFCLLFFASFLPFSLSPIEKDARKSSGHCRISDAASLTHHGLHAYRVFQINECPMDLNFLFTFTQCYRCH